VLTAHARELEQLSAQKQELVTRKLANSKPTTTDYGAHLTRLA